MFAVVAEVESGHPTFSCKLFFHGLMKSEIYLLRKHPHPFQEVP